MNGISGKSFVATNKGSDRSICTTGGRVIKVPCNSSTPIPAHYREKSKSRGSYRLNDIPITHPTSCNRIGRLMEVCNVISSKMSGVWNAIGMLPENVYQCILKYSVQPSSVSVKLSADPKLAKQDRTNLPEN